MKNHEFKEKLQMFIVFVGLIIFSRIIPHIPNLTAMGAVALMSGYYFRSSLMGLFVAPTAFILSDLILGGVSFAPVSYLTMGLVAYIGQSFHHQKKEKVFLLPLLLGSVMSSGLFFLTSNFMVWVEGGLYPHTFSGLINCYWMAIPFLRNEFAGTLIYGSILLGVIVLFETKIKAKSHN